MKISYIYYIIIGGIVLFLPFTSLAKADLSLTETDITFSKSDIIAGEMVKMYARVFNIGDTDVTAYVQFLNNGKEMAPPQLVSVRPNTYDDVFIDWKAASGNNNISAKIIAANPKEDVTVNNTTVAKGIFVDTDTNHNSIADTIDAKTATSTTSSSTQTQAKSNSTTVLKTDSEQNDKPKESSVANIQETLDNFAENNPIKSGIESINKKITDQVSKWYNLTLRDNKDTDAKNSDSSFQFPDFQNLLTASIPFNLQWDKKYLYLVIVALGILAAVFLFLFFKKRKNHQYQEEE